MASPGDWEKLADYYTYAANCARNVAHHMRQMEAAADSLAKAKASLQSNEDEIKKWREKT